MIDAILEQYKEHFSKNCTIVSDDSHSIQTFVSENKFEHDIIPSNAFTTPKGNSVSSVNEMHTQIKNLIRWKHGISTRHLQGYLDWLVFRKKLKYTLEMKRWRAQAYMDTMQELIPFNCEDIVKLEMPIDLYQAYGDYHYGIFSNIN